MSNTGLQHSIQYLSIAINTKTALRVELIGLNGSPNRVLRTMGVNKAEPAGSAYSVKNKLISA